MTLSHAAVAVLTEPDPRAKAARARAMAEGWRTGALAAFGSAAPPDRPARPPRPELLPPRMMPKRRRAQTPAGRKALLHAIAHIEFNAIDLACDLIARFGAGFPPPFLDDWVKVADEEALHFDLIRRRLDALGFAYGDLPAHDGLWQAAMDTAGDALARLAIVPLVLEARGLDVTPAMMASLRRAGDEDSAEVLQRIYTDEIGHVAAGQRWFAFLCARRGLQPETAWHALVRAHFPGGLRRPFNQPARDRAGLPPAFYEPVAGD